MSRFKARSGWGQALPSSCSYPGGESAGYFASTRFLGLAHPRLHWCLQPYFYLQRSGRLRVRRSLTGLSAP